MVKQLKVGKLYKIIRNSVTAAWPGPERWADISLPNNGWLSLYTGDIFLVITKNDLGNYQILYKDIIGILELSIKKVRNHRILRYGSDLEEL
jgi:hypothetical protein